MELNFTQTSPIFRILDEKLAKEFYVDYLSFAVEFEHRFAADLPLYMGLKLSNFELHLSEHTGDSSPHSGVYIQMTGLKEYYNFLISKDSKFSKPKLEDTDFGTVCMTITDPFQNRLGFNETKSSKA